MSNLASTRSKRRADNGSPFADRNDRHADRREVWIGADDCFSSSLLIDGEHQKGAGVVTPGTRSQQDALSVQICKAAAVSGAGGKTLRSVGEGELDADHVAQSTSHNRGPPYLEILLLWNIEVLLPFRFSGRFLERTSRNSRCSYLFESCRLGRSSRGLENLRRISS